MGKLVTIRFPFWLVTVTLISISVSAQTSSPGTGLLIDINTNSALLSAGEWITFQTEITNTGNTDTPYMVAHLNVTSIQPGRYVDPEDWSPKRTEYLQPIQHGESEQINWRVHTLFNGDFAVFVTLIYEEKYFMTLSSPALHIQVKPGNILPMNKVAPVAAIVPLFPLVLLFFTGIYTRKQRQLSKDAKE